MDLEWKYNIKFTKLNKKLKKGVLWRRLQRELRMFSIHLAILIANKEKEKTLDNNWFNFYF